MDDEKLTKDLLDALSIICNWSTYTGTHCRRTINLKEKKKCCLCPVHEDLILDFKTNNDEEEILCEMNQIIKFTPRSFKHLKSIMKQLNNEDDQVDIQINNTVGGLTEEADITNPKYIKILSDDTLYYYDTNDKTKKHVKNLKIVLKKYCQNKAIIQSRGVYQCEECYKKTKNVPRISVVKKFEKNKS